MNAMDLMTKAPTTICPEHSIWHAAQIMLAEHISGIPVLSEDGALAGIVTEGDLLRRTELGTEGAFPDPHDADAVARAYVKSHSWKVGDVMTKNVFTIAESASLREIAMLIAQHGIKRLPVLREGRLVGIVSRTDLLKVIATGKPDAQVRGDEAVRRAIVARLSEAASVLSTQPDVVVEGGIVQVTGDIRSPAERDAIRVIVESVAGPGFKDHLSMSEKLW
jgi:CBS domain-containing protein